MLLDFKIYLKMRVKNYNKYFGTFIHNEESRLERKLKTYILCIVIKIEMIILMKYID